MTGRASRNRTRRLTTRTGTARHCKPREKLLQHPLLLASVDRRQVSVTKLCRGLVCTLFQSHNPSWVKIILLEMLIYRTNAKACEKPNVANIMNYGATIGAKTDMKICDGIKMWLNSYVLEWAHTHHGVYTLRKKCTAAKSFLLWA